MEGSQGGAKGSRWELSKEVGTRAETKKKLRDDKTYPTKVIGIYSKKMYQLSLKIGAQGRKEGAVGEEKVLCQGKRRGVGWSSGAEQLPTRPCSNALGVSASAAKVRIKREKGKQANDQIVYDL